MNILSKIVLLVLLSAFAASPARSGQADIDKVQGLIEAGELDEALRAAQAYIQNHPQDPQMRFLEGLIFTTQAQWQEAIKVFRALSLDFPELPAPLNNLAVAYAEIGKYDLALETLKEALQINPEYASAHENLGDIHVTLAALSYRQAMLHKGKQQTANAKLKVLVQLIPDLAAASSSRQETPKSKPQSTSIAAGLPADPIQSKEIETFVNAWASAWSSQDVDKYLDFYSGNFQPTGGKSLLEWRSERKVRLTAPEYIRVQVLNVASRLSADSRAQVTITQQYESNTYRGTALKYLTLERQGDQWKIVQELVRRE